ncbi:MAG: response regulator [Ahrensia sp.]|nr:response regulator [Ahrensia sp.]
MADRKITVTKIEPLVYRGSRPAKAIRLMALGAFVLVGLGFLFFFREVVDEGFLLGLLGVLAMIGVFFLFAMAIGLVEFSSSRASDDIGGSFLNSLSEGICVTDEKNDIVYANKAYGDLTGVKNVVDLQSLENVLSHQEEAANALYRLANNAQNSAEIDEEFRLSTSLQNSGTGAHWYRAAVHSMIGPNNSIMRAWRLTDITNERDAQEKFFLDLQKAIDHLDRAPVGFYASDTQGQLQYINATLAEWLGIDLTSFVAGSRNIEDILAHESLRLVRAVTGEPGTTRTAILDLDMAKASGERLPVQLIHRVQTHSDGVTVQSRTIVINRTEGEEASQDLRSAEVRFTRFFNSTPMAIAAIDRDGRILRTNSSFDGLFGAKLGQGELARRPKFETLIEERDHQRFGKMFAAARQNQVNIEPLDCSLSADNSGEEKHIRVFVNAVAPVMGVESELEVEEAAIVYAMDVTEQKALENEMAQSQKMQAVGQLAGGIAHDFNNVLTAIIMASDLLLTNHRPSDPSFPDIMNIKQNANRAASLVRQLLAFSRRQTLRPAVLSLTDVLADLRMLLSRLIGSNINLTIEHGRDLWPVKVDLGQFEQVIVNLTVNARDAMPNGGDLTVRSRNVLAEEIPSFNYRGLEVADYVMIDVVDTGTGIEPEILKKIFEPFFTTKEVGKGTGLGLSMVYGIIKQTGGYIYADSELGAGTTFHLLLPRHIPTEAELAEPKVVDALPDKKRDLSGSATILLVEDEDSVRMGGLRALRSRGYTVHEASDGMEALDILEELKGEVDLIVSDVVMPEMDGPTLLREVRKDYADIKFIFVSGYAEDAFAKSLPEGAQFGFLPKPFSLKQLATTVKETLEA